MKVKLLIVLAFTFLFATAVLATKGDKCTKIQSGELYGSDGSLLTTGFNEWGYNYQGMMYNGMYCDYHPIYRPGGAQHDWCMENYSNDKLMMKWNDSWLSNKDCDDNGLLDRHYGYPSYIGSGAWLTNHISGEYEEEGKTCKWNYFTKIVAAPEDAYEEDDIWYNADGEEIGPEIWGAFATIQEVSNDTCTGEHGLLNKSPVRPGLGNW